MRIGTIFLAALLAATGCKSSDKDKDKSAARKLRKMDFHTTIDDRGRLKIAFRLFDNKHDPMAVTGSYTVEVTKLDGALVCKAAGELAKADFSEKGTHQAPWHDANCPADPGVDEVKVNVKVTVPGAGGGGKDEKGKDTKDEKGKDTKDAAKDVTFDRSVTLPLKSIYDRPPVRKPPETKPAEGSAAKPAEGSAAKPTEGSAATPAAKPADTSATPSTEKPAETKPAEKPAETKPATP